MYWNRSTNWKHKTCSATGIRLARLGCIMVRWHLHRFIYLTKEMCSWFLFSGFYIFYERLNDSNSFLQWVTKSPIHLLWNHKLGQLQQLVVPFMPTKTTRKCIHYINIARAAVLFCCLPFIDHTIFLYATYTLLNNNTSILYVMRHNIKNNAYNGKQCKIKTLEKFEKVT